MDGRSRELGHDYVYGTAGGKLLAYDDPPEPAEKDCRTRRPGLRRAESALSRLLLNHAKAVRRAYKAWRP